MKKYSASAAMHIANRTLAPRANGVTVRSEAISLTGLTPTDDLPRDHNVYCKRNNGETYAVLTPSAWRRLRTQEKLDAYLKSRRE